MMHVVSGDGGYCAARSAELEREKKRHAATAEDAAGDTATDPGEAYWAAFAALVDSGDEQGEQPSNPDA